MGFGWNHSYRASIAQHSDPNASFGRRTPEQAASAIVALYILRDLGENDYQSAKGWLTASIIADWAIGGIFDNTATIVAGRKNLNFVRLADGSYSSPPGITASLEKDDTTGTYALHERFGRITQFDANNRLSSLVDADGKSLSLTYGGGGLLSTVTDCYGRTLTFTYVNGYLDHVTDSTGRTVSYGYDGAGHLTSVTDPENGVTHYFYDASGRLEKVVDAENKTVVENTYDQSGRVAQQVAEGDPNQTWLFTFAGKQTLQTDPLGHQTTLFYDDKGRHVGTIDALGHRTAMAYDGQDHLVSLTDPNDHTTTYDYDGRNNLRFVTNANNHTTEFIYDASDHLHQIKDAAGKTTTFDYDGEHHLTKITDPILRETTFEYYAAGAADGLLENVIAPGGDTTTFGYDANGHPSTITRGDASVIHTTYNARGDLTYSKITTTGDSNLHEAMMTYDKRRLPLTARDALNFGVTNGYDARGRLVSQTDRFGNSVSQTFSPWGRKETATMPNGATSTYHHDTAGRRDSVTDALTHLTQYGFDQADRLGTVTDALTQVMNYGYDAAGNRSSLTNTRQKSWSWIHTAINQVDTLTSPMNRVWDSGYDTRELLETFKQPSLQTTTFQYYDDQRLAQTNDPVGSVNYAYDGKGRPDTVTVGTALIDRDYDALDRLVKFKDAAGNVIEYSYDGAGNLRTLKYPGNKTVTYTYDSADRLDFVTDWAGRVTDFQYDANSRLSAMVFPNGTQRKFSYDAAGRVASLRDETSTLQIISQFGFGYDVLNRINQELATPEAAPFTIQPAAMTFDDDDRLLTWNGQTCVSDADGNLTTGPLNGNLATFGYDARNRLTSAGGTTYAYDAENRRMTQTTGGVTTSYVHDPQAALSRLLMRTKGATTTYYVYGAGMLLYEETAGATKTYHFDYRGSTVAITDDNQLVTDRVTYGPYGETVARQGASDTSFLYNGAWGVQTDANGLCYMRARYYSVETRRFLNADPLGFEAGANWYAFGSGDPVMHIDPSGFAGLELFGPGDELQGKATKIKTIVNGYYTVAGHQNIGAPGLTIVDNPALGVGIGNVSATRLGKLIEQQKNYPQGTPILLLICNAGAPNTRDFYPVAQLVANYLGVEVKATPLYVTFDARGYFYPNWNSISGFELFFGVGLSNTDEFVSFWPRTQGGCPK